MYKLVSRSWSLREGKGGGRPAAAKAPTTHIPDEPLHGGPGTVSDKTPRTPSYNGHVTPADASTSAHQYASRPLPATPHSKFKMADRPSTSGGPDSKKSAKNDFKFDKRMSRDDFYLGSRAYEGTRSGPFAPFRGQPPSPDISPKTAPVQRFVSRTNTWEPATGSMGEARDGDIGMALGSPTHPPTGSGTWNPQGAVRPRKVSAPLATPPASRGSSVDTFDMPVSRKPTGKWKLFGMFGRKQSDQSVPAVSISDPNGLRNFHKPEEGVVMSSQPPQSDLKSPARSNTISSRKAPRHKPIVVRSQTMPLEVKSDIYDQKLRSEKRGDGEFGRIPIALDTGSNLSPVTGPLLNVEIPDVRLERYSVMFNSVLNSNPSLLTRRQAAVQKLKSIEDAVEREEEEKVRGVSRRATSPQPAAKASGLALFPNSRQGHLMPQKLSPRLRSNTSPALLPSPSKVTFDHTTHSYKRPSIQQTSSLKHSGHRSHPPHPEKSTVAVSTMEQETVSIPHQFSNDQSHLVLDSPTEVEPAGYDAIKTQTWKPSSHHLPPEPKWQMISPSQKTPSTASSYTSSYRKRSPSVASSALTHITRQSEDSDDASYLDIANNGGNKAMTPAEISIARQISMSRQQRKLLQPLRTGQGPSPSPSPGRRPSHASPARTSPMTGVAVGQNGRLAETKMATPTLVHPPETLDSQLALAQHRRSERIVLEGA
ncbi:hypothetical protein HD806DRAFT_530459 [Xylariaceae sp. AK1471]|nr:hypothetical protein HD806DRAFT_530459 [Xylariaceae sp. AK1471]